MSYDEGLSTWGEPVSVFQGDKVFIVTWGAAQVGPGYTVAVPVGKSVIVQSGQNQSGWKILATFNKEARVLTKVIFTEW